MVNISLEIIFWLTLIIYIGAKFTQTKKGYKKEFKKIL